MLPLPAYLKGGVCNASALACTQSFRCQSLASLSTLADTVLSGTTAVGDPSAPQDEPLMQLYSRSDMDNSTSQGLEQLSTAVRFTHYARTLRINPADQATSTTLPCALRLQDEIATIGGPVLAPGFGISDGLGNALPVVVGPYYICNIEPNMSTGRTNVFPLFALGPWCDVSTWTSAAVIIVTPSAPIAVCVTATTLVSAGVNFATATVTVAASTTPSVNLAILAFVPSPVLAQLGNLTGDPYGYANAHVAGAP